MSNFSKLKKRIKKNEGFSNIIYLDQLGYQTIGYGHLIKKKDKFTKGKRYKKKHLAKIFEDDFKIALNNFRNHYKKKFSKNVQEVLIEMIFQLGIKKTIKFKRFNFFLKKNLHHLAAIEMIDSLWYQQTPTRVDGLINILLRYKK